MSAAIGTRLGRLLVLGAAMVVAVAFADVAHAGDLLGTPAAPTVTATTQPVAAATQPVTQAAAPVTSAAEPTPSAPAPTPALPTSSASTVTDTAKQTVSAATSTVTQTASATTSTVKSAANDVTSAARPLVETATDAVASASAPVLRTATDITKPTVNRIASTSHDTQPLLAARSPASTPSAPSAPLAGRPSSPAIVVTTLGSTAHRAATHPTPAPTRPRSSLRNDMFFGSTATSSATSSPSRQYSTPRVPRPPPKLPLPDSGLLTSLGGASAGGLLLVGLLCLAFLLTIPNAVRWLRPAVALGLSPAYVAPGDRPG